LIEEGKIRSVANLLEANPDRWFTVGEVVSELVPGFENVPGRFQGGIKSYYSTYVHGAREELDDRGKTLIRKGWGDLAKYKIATDSEEDQVYVEDLLNRMRKLSEGALKKKELRERNLEKVIGSLPGSGSPSS